MEILVRTKNLENTKCKNTTEKAKDRGYLGRLEKKLKKRVERKKGWKTKRKNCRQKLTLKNGQLWKEGGVN